MGRFPFHELNAKLAMWLYPAYGSRWLGQGDKGI